MVTRIASFLPALLVGFFMCPNSWAINSAACSKMLNEGLYKTYKFAGFGESNGNAITGETKRSGSSRGSTNVSSDQSTAVLDPKHSTNLSYSQSQSSSSTGECNAFAIKELRAQRDFYIAENFDQVRKEIAQGQGFHMEALAWMSLCDIDSQKDFNEILQTHYEEIYPGKISQPSLAIDNLIGSSRKMEGKCFNLSSL